MESFIPERSGDESLNARDVITLKLDRLTTEGKTPQVKDQIQRTRRHTMKEADAATVVKSDLPVYANRQAWYGPDMQKKGAGFITFRHRN